MGVFADVVRQRISAELTRQVLPPTAQLELIVDHLQRLTNELGSIAPDMMSAFITERGGALGVEELNAGLAELIVGVVRQGQTDGSFTAHASAEIVALSLVSAWVGVARHHVSQGAECDGSPLRRVLELFLDGLATRR